MTRTEKPLAVAPFRIIVDNQEQAPWRFTNILAADDAPLVVNLITDRHLPTGDYSIEGYEDKITIERKSLSDFYGSIGGGREREERKAERMGEIARRPGGYAAYIIEAGWHELLNPAATQSQVPVAAARGTIAAWAVRYGIGFWLMPGRRNAEVWCYRLLEMFWRQEQRKLDTLAKALESLPAQ